MADRTPRLSSAWTWTSAAGTAGARRGALHAPRLRRPLDGADRARGGHLEGAALPLLPEQAGVLPGDPRRRRPRSSHARRRPTRHCRRRAARAASTPSSAGRGELGRLHQAASSAASVPEVESSSTRPRGHGATGSSRGSRRETPPPARRAAVRGWLWFMDGALWTGSSTATSSARQLLGLLLGTLLGAVTAAGEHGLFGGRPG